MITIKDFGDYRAIQLSSIPEPVRSEFKQWLAGTIAQNDWAYIWDWWKFNEYRKAANTTKHQ